MWVFTEESEHKMASVWARNVWLLLVVLRLTWTCLPQAGYIHPDEFFQSVEVALGVALNSEF